MLERNQAGLKLGYTEKTTCKLGNAVQQQAWVFAKQTGHYFEWILQELEKITHEEYHQIWNGH